MAEPTQVKQSGQAPETAKPATPEIVGKTAPVSPVEGSRFSFAPGPTDRVVTEQVEMGKLPTTGVPTGGGGSVEQQLEQAKQESLDAATQEALVRAQMAQYVPQQEPPKPESVEPVDVTTVEDIRGAVSRGERSVQYWDANNQHWYYTSMSPADLEKANATTATVYRTVDGRIPLAKPGGDDLVTQRVLDTKTADDYKGAKVIAKPSVIPGYDSPLPDVVPLSYQKSIVNKEVASAPGETLMLLPDGNYMKVSDFRAYDKGIQDALTTIGYQNLAPGIAAANADIKARNIAIEGIQARQDEQTAAIKTMDKYSTDGGKTYNIVTYLKEGGDPQTLITAGFQEDAVRTASETADNLKQVETDLSPYKQVREFPQRGAGGEVMLPSGTSYDLKQYFFDNPDAGRKPLETAGFKSEDIDTARQQANQLRVSIGGIDNLDLTDFKKALALQNAIEQSGISMGKMTETERQMLTAGNISLESGSGAALPLVVDPEKVAGVWEGLSDRQKANVAAIYDADKFKGSLFAEQYATTERATGEGGLAAQLVISPVLTIARVPAKLSTGQAVTGREYAEAGAMAALVGLGVAGGALSEAGTLGKVASAGIQAGATGVFVTGQIKDWSQMSLLERSVALGMDSLLVFGVARDVKALPSSLNRDIASAINNGKLTVDWADYRGQTSRLNPERMVQINNAIANVNESIKSESVDAVIKSVDNLNKEVAKARELDPYIQKLVQDGGQYIKENAAAIIRQSQPLKAGEALPFDTTAKAGLEKGTITLAEAGKPTEVKGFGLTEQQIQNRVSELQRSNTWGDARENLTNMKDDLTKVSEKPTVSDSLSKQDWYKAGNEPVPFREESRQPTYQEAQAKQLIIERVSRLVEKMPSAQRARLFEGSRAEIFSTNPDVRQAALQEMWDYLEMRFGKDNLEHYIKTGDWLSGNAPEGLEGTIKGTEEAQRIADRIKEDDLQKQDVKDALDEIDRILKENKDKLADEPLSKPSPTEGGVGVKERTETKPKTEVQPKTAQELEQMMKESAREKQTEPKPETKPTERIVTETKESVFPGIETRPGTLVAPSTSPVSHELAITLEKLGILTLIRPVPQEYVRTSAATAVSPQAAPSPMQAPSPTPVPTPSPVPIPSPVPMPTPVPSPIPTPIPVPTPTPSPLPMPATRAAAEIGVKTTTEQQVKPITPRQQRQQEKERQVISRIQPGTLVWKQGEPAGGPMWRGLYPPYDVKKDKFILRRLPPGAHDGVTGEGSAYATLQMIGGLVPMDKKLDLGWAIVRIKSDGRNQPTMEYLEGPDANLEGINQYTETQAKPETQPTPTVVESTQVPVMTQEVPVKQHVGRPTKEEVAARQLQPQPVLVKPPSDQTLRRRLANTPESVAYPDVDPKTGQQIWKAVLPPYENPETDTMILQGKKPSSTTIVKDAAHVTSAIKLLYRKPVSAKIKQYWGLAEPNGDTERPLFSTKKVDLGGSKEVSITDRSNRIGERSRIFPLKGE